MDTKHTVWFITGASKGLGLALVKQLLDQGHRVAATSRNVDELRAAVATNTPNFLPLHTDLGVETSVAEAIRQTVAHFGRLDVVVNNAGYAQWGGLEELTDHEARTNFEVNVFGALNVIRHASPELRQQRTGHIINISSVGGFTGQFAGAGIYCATKFALSGLSESLAAEVREFGVKVTVVEPGYLRTSFLTADSLGLPRQPIAAYTAVRESQALHTGSIDGQQPGDPEKAAAAIIAVAAEAQPPLHLFLGQDAYDLVQQKIDALQQELATWKHLTTGIAFEEPAAAG